LKKVLIVEDELFTANFLVDIFNTLGFESKILTEGKPVLTTAREWKPNLITLDIMIPSPNGIEVLSELKSDPDTKSIPVFIVSVVANRSDLRDQLATACAIFEKPFEIKELIEKVQNVCEVSKPEVEESFTS